MTTVHNSPLRTYRALTRRADRQEVVALRKEKAGVRIKSWRERMRANPEKFEQWIAAGQENRRIGFVSEPRALPFVGFNRFSRAVVDVALTPSQMKDRNRALLLKAVVKKNKVDTALEMKTAADGGRRHRRTHPFTDGRSV
jgi:hypothetical protein